MVIIPDALRRFTNYQPMLRLNCSTIELLLKQLLYRYPELRQHLIDSYGRIRSFIDIFVGDTNIKNLQFEKTVVSSISVVRIVPATRAY